MTPTNLRCHPLSLGTRCSPRHAGGGKQPRGRPIAANDRDPAITAAIPVASSPASGCRRPRLFRGSGTWARRPSRYWLRAAVIGADVIGGRVSSWQKVASVRTSIVPPGPCPPPANTPLTSAAGTTLQVTDSRHDFAVSLGLFPGGCRRSRVVGRVVAGPGAGSRFRLALALSAASMAASWPVSISVWSSDAIPREMPVSPGCTRRSQMLEPTTWPEP
jgi:hypothetical protein